MTSQDNQFSLLDALSVISFAISLANYSENLDQSQVQEMLQSAVSDIHKHLELQDRKLNAILAILTKEEI